MSKPAAWRRYLRFLRSDPAADLEDELRDHLASTVEELIRRGAPPEKARAEAARRFGDVTRASCYRFWEIYSYLPFLVRSAPTTRA